MTTANLSIGIKTAPALEQLRALKTQMQAEMKGVKIGFDAKELNSVLKEGISTLLRIHINKNALKEDIEKALTGSFKETYKVSIDTATLTSQVHAAVQAGMTGLKVSVGSVSAGQGAGPVDMKSMVTQMGAAVSDAVANQVGKAVQKVQAQEGKSASQSYSAKMQSGASLSASEKLPHDEAMRAIQLRNEEKMKEDLAKESATETFRARMRERAYNDKLAQGAAAFGPNQNVLNTLRASEQAIRNRQGAGVGPDREGLLKARDALDAREQAAARKEQDALNREGAQVGPNRNKILSLRDAINKSRAESAQREQEALNREGATVGLNRDQVLALRDASNKKQLDQARREQDALNREGATVGPGRDKLLSLRDAINKRQAEQAQREQEALNREGASVGLSRDKVLSLRDAANKKQIDQANREQDALNREGAKVGPGRDKLLSLRDAIDKRRAEAAQREQEQLNREGAAVGLSRDQVLALRDAAVKKQLDQSAREQEALNREGAQVGPNREKLLNIRDAYNKRVNDNLIREQEALNKAGAQFGPGREELMRLRDKAQNDLVEQAKRDLRRAMQNVYNSAKEGAAGEYTNRGQRIAGAKAVMQAFPTQGAEYLNNDGLIAQIKHLDDHRVKVKAASDAVDDHKKKTSLLNPAYRAWKDGMNEVHSGARGLAGSLGLLWTTWGSVAPLVAMAALGGAMRSVFTVGKDLEYQLTFVSALSNNSVVSMSKFGDAVRQGMTVAPTEAAQAMRGLAQNGLSVSESLQALPTILQLATVGEMALTEAALGATGVMAAFNLQVSDLGHISDVFTKAAALSNTSVTGMVEAMKQASTVSDQYKVSLEDTAATLAVLAKRNISGTAAGTAFRNMMVELTTPHEKAARAMKIMGLELYDNSKQLKDYGSVLDQLRSKTSTLNEQGRLTFLNEMFGERGAKAANALLSDYESFREIQKQIKEESKDFAKSVADSLQGTTNGKLKALVTEFQLSTSEVFTKAGTEVNYFIDRLRQAAASTEFKAALDAVAQSILSFTNFLAENGKVVLTTVAAWMAFKAVGVAVAGITAVIAALEAAAIAGSVASVAMKAFWSAATGGVAVLVVLAAEFLSYSRNVGEAEQAQNRFKTELDLSRDALDRQLQALRDNNAMLDRRNDLMRQGMTLEQANRQLEKEGGQTKTKKLLTDVENAKTEITRQKALIAEIEAEQVAAFNVGPESIPFVPREAELQSARRALSKAEANLQEVSSQEQKHREILFRKDKEDWGNEHDRRVKAVQDFNRRIDQAMKDDPRLKLGDLKIKSINDVLYPDKDTADKYMASRETALNKRLHTFNVPGPHANSEASADVKDLLSRMDLARKRLEQELDLKKTIESVQYSDKVVGSEVAAYMAEQRAIEGTTRLRALDFFWMEKIENALNDGRLNEASKKSLGTALERKSAQYDESAFKLKKESEVASARFAIEEQERLDKRTNTLDVLKQKVTELNKEIGLSYSKQYEDPMEAARKAAENKVENIYADDILKAKEKVTQAERNYGIMREKSLDSTDEEVTYWSNLVILAERKLNSERESLDVLLQRRNLDRERTGNNAAERFQYSLSAEAGWDRYWKEYRDVGASSADYVYQAMKKSTDQMGDALAEFAATGKINFGSLIRSMIAEQARLAASSLWKDLIKMVGAQFGGWSAGDSPAPGADVTGVGAVPYAEGGIMTSYGNLPLRKFDAGGIARSPMAAIFGEGRKPEAYVPLQDGRTIPVTMQGAEGGSKPVNLTWAPSISVDSRTDRADVQRIVDRSLAQYHEASMAQMKELGLV